MGEGAGGTKTSLPLRQPVTNAVLSVRKRGGSLFPENGMYYREPNSQKNLPEGTAPVKNACRNLKKELGTFIFPKTFAESLSFFPSFLSGNLRINHGFREREFSRGNGSGFGLDVLFSAF